MPKSTPTQIVTHPMPGGTLGELRQFLALCSDLPADTTVVTKQRIGGGSTRGARPKEISAERYPEQT